MSYNATTKASDRLEWRRFIVPGNSLAHSSYSRLSWQWHVLVRYCSSVHKLTLVYVSSHSGP